MKLIGAGLPRTGTLTQKVALEMLGVGPCYHMVNVLAQLELVPQWRRALEGNGDWEGIFDGFESTVDWPGAYFYRELIEVYPEAKVLLSIRDPGAWARSMQDTIWATLYGDVLLGYLSSARAEIDPAWNSYVTLMSEMWETTGLSGPDADLGSMSSAMQRYHDEVRRTVPAGRLLEWCPADGWEPLCAFLEVPVPETPLPHLNDSRHYCDRIIDGALLSVRAWQRQDEPQTAREPATS
jgi:hypothetical protein